VPPQKGLITDRDDTLWAGILGELSVEGITWGHVPRRAVDDSTSRLSVELAPRR
jgi:hypothetical protein